MTEPSVELTIAWQRHLGAPGRGPSGREALAGLLARHREPHRHYHTLDHVVWVLRHVRELVRSEPVDDLDAVAVAAMYHDAVYERRAGDDEAASARLAARDLAELGWERPRIDHVVAMIEGTATHLDPPDVDTAILFDADLAVLAASPAAYADYVRQVRREYAHLDDSVWTTGRRAVLERFLDRRAIYTTSAGRSTWEERARANLASELAVLRSATA